MKLEVGRITKAHGLRGEVVVGPITDRPDRFVAGATFEGFSPIFEESFKRKWDSTAIFNAE